MITQNVLFCTKRPPPGMVRPKDDLEGLETPKMLVSKPVARIGRAFAVKDFQPPARSVLDSEPARKTLRSDL